MREFLVALTILLGLAGCNMSLEEADAAQKSVYLVLVNKTNALPDGWESYVQLDTVRNSFSEEVRIEHKTYKQYLRLRDELFKQGVQIELDSVYRSVAEQQEIWDAWSNDPELGEEYCKKYLAAPGYSEHHTGLAVDIFILKDDEEIRDNDDMIADTEDFAKIHALLPKYGFILRYPEGKEDITGYAYEPWHLRYVGKKVAREITKRGITLEEYLEK